MPYDRMTKSPNTNRPNSRINKQMLDSNEYKSANIKISQLFK